MFHKIPEICSRVELVPWSDGGGIADCPLQSQLQRLFAFDLPYVGGDDVVVTTDADAFPMRRDILDVLWKEGPSVWLLQYEYAAATETTFPMCFVAMTADAWRAAMDAK